ncbi:PREDICTED: galactosylceramide sulfotransferase-like [Branchiostoma belcheri]|uniref:Galactosylceramide sulfotransferase-like n=1 Tax=Branchiostoma belcheri TaxID=7741 RepID=A0A6P4Z8I7_BRABE|nr:PREDICTED: galactosylceramide sulfotransferase-like [Branchiostoma belcheri]XP_019625934.1 PREDICTED: galactosylceramide sulfotransferase-like [Branchiostoma belcheri]XP_019625935.1 PREDICTED: galactosylceramide sulfotransferase-like [Branchiostoma belcheri]XP_019625936.1 PREDICTED: galactosylceramide sulfotransferase-like [Branchiostoma belcheri]
MVKMGFFRPTRKFLFLSFLILSAGAAYLYSNNGVELSPKVSEEIVIGNLAGEKGSRLRACRPETKIAFIKTHKTGSSSLMQIFQRFGYLRNLSFVLPRSNNINHLYPYGIRDPNKYIPPEKKEFDILTHHTVYDRATITKLLSANATFVTIIREPMDRLKSAFNFYKLDKTYHIPGPNALLKFLEHPEKYENNIKGPSGYLIKNNMAIELGFPLKNPTSGVKNDNIRDFVDKISREFDLVMVMEYFDESLVLLRRQLCWDMQDILNFKYNSFKYDLGNTSFPKQLVENYRRHDAIDYALYEHFNRTLWRKIKKTGSDFWDELAHFRWLQTTMKTQCNRKSGDFAPIYIGETAWNAGFNMDSAFCTWMKVWHHCYFILLRDRSLRIQQHKQKGPEPSKMSPCRGILCRPYCVLCEDIRKACTLHEYAAHLYREGLLSPTQSSSAKLTNPVPHHGGKPEPLS